MPLRHLNQALRKLPRLAVCVVLLLGHAALPVLAEEPFGIGLEGFAYPYPVHMFVIPEGGERLNMAYMDVAPEGDSNGRTAPPPAWPQLPLELLAGHDQGACRKRLPRRRSRPDRYFGKSSKPLSDLHFDALARNTAALLDSLHIETVDIVAHSMGGMLATRFARTYPARVERMVLAAPIGLEDYRLYVPPAQSEKLIEQEAKVTPEPYRRWLMTAYELTLPPEALDPYVEARTRIRGSADFPRWLVAYVNSYQMIWREPVPRPKFRFSPSPCCSSWARTTTSRPAATWPLKRCASKMGHNVELARELAAKMPKANVEVFEGAGHLIHLEAPQRFTSPW